MNTRQIRFFLVSLCLHLAAFWTLSAVPAEHGMASGGKAVTASRSALTVSLLPQGHTPQKSVSQVPATGSGAMTLQSARPLSTAPSLDPPAAPPAKDNADALTDQGYLAAGSLTRLPMPEIPIDLDVSEFTGMEPAGAIELTILIDANGVVADVRTPDADGMAGIFAARVAERFRNARFTPGEIDGRPVRARLQVTVVSEKLPAVEMETVEIEPPQAGANAVR